MDSDLENTLEQKLRLAATDDNNESPLVNLDDSNDQSGDGGGGGGVEAFQSVVGASNMMNDAPDFEYDEEEMNQLVAEEYDDDFGSFLDPADSYEEAKLGTSQFTEDNLIDEDFEAEIGAPAQLVNLEAERNDTERQAQSIRERIDRFNVVNVCGTDTAGRPIIVLAACNLPDEETIMKEKEFFKTHQQFFDLLLEVLTEILQRYVECEYTLVYFHYGLKNTSQPSFNWLAKVYKMLDRKFKKNLKALYVVHPSTFFKVLWQFIRPLISSKFHKKVTYCNTLNALASFIDLSHLKIPSEVKNYDYQLTSKKRTTSMYNIIPAASAAKTEYGPFQQFKVPLEHIAKTNKGDPIPLCIKETIVFLRKNLHEEGLFRKSGSYERIRQIQDLYNSGEPVAYDSHEFHVAACVVKAFVRELPDSLLSETIFSEMMSIQVLDLTDRVEVTKDLLNAKLPTLNYTFLAYLVEFLAQVASHSSENKMDARNLSYVFGPNFLRKEEFSLIDVEKINNFVELLIRYHGEIFVKD